MVLQASVCVSQELYDKTIKAADAQPEAYVPLLKGKRVALVINQTSVVAGVSLLDILIGRKVHVVKIFVPEHGFRGKEDAGARVDNAVDNATRLPIVSLYGKHKQPTAEDLADVDVVVYDLQDVGVRFYTYISTLEYCMAACAENHKQIMVLDRPDPNGFYVDGPLPDRDNKSFVCMQHVPVVYGMTAGEYAGMLKASPRPSPGEREDISPRPSTLPPSAPSLEKTEGVNSLASVDLVVIKCVNYSHKKKYELPVAPSPNLRTMAAVYAYASLCLFEGTVVSVGRGTDMPFQQFGNPEMGQTFEYNFTPRSMEGAKSPPYEGKMCFGDVIGTDAREVLEKVDNKFSLEWLLMAYKAYPEKEKFFNAFFATLCGSKQLQEQIVKGATEAEIRKSWEGELKEFEKVRKKYLLYEDFE